MLNRTQSSNRPFSLTSRLPLRFILTVPFIMIITVAVALNSYLSFHNSQATVNNIAEQLLDEINARIGTHLEAFLQIPHRINQSTANAIRLGTLDASDEATVGRYFWEQVQVYDSVTSIYFGNTGGGLILGGREGADGSLYVMATAGLVQGPLMKYATDNAGNQGEVLATVPDFDARVRPWYTGALERQDANWTAPYVLSTGQDLAIAASLPVYDPDGDLLGVTSVDIFISHINDFLHGLSIGKTGQAYIVDQSGLLVATSTDTPLAQRDANSLWQRLPAIESTDRIIATSAQHIHREFSSFAAIDQPQQQKFTIAGDTHYLWVTPYHDPSGLDWLIVLTIPEDDFFAQIEAHNRTMVLLAMIAIAAAIGVGIFTTWQVSKPILRLSQAASEIAKGNWNQQVPLWGTWEVYQLGVAFNTMAAQLLEVFTHLEERVRVRTAELAASEARYRGIVEDQTELICRFRPEDNTLTFVNVAYCRFFDKTPEALIGQSFMPRIPDEDHPKFASQLARLTPANPTVAIEHRVILANASIRWMQWVNRALYDEHNNLVEIQAVGRDITDYKQFEEQLQKALAHEIELNELKTHFISTVSHEFRTPMTVILNASEILEKYRDRISPEKQADYFGRIKTQIHHMTNMLQDVLTINRAEHGKLEFNPEVLDVEILCRNAVNEIRATADWALTFTYAIEGDCRTVTADKKLLGLIIRNLVSNAVKVSSPNGTIRIGIQCNHDHLIFSVQDEGVGIPPDAQARIFEPFFRADNMVALPGTGLGLAIVKHSVEQHGGTITFTSEEGNGTTFTVTLPGVVDTE